MDYCAQITSPHMKYNIKILEDIQRRATKLASQIRKKSYEERLKIFCISTLEDRRTRGDLIQMYKIAHNLEIINWVTPINWKKSRILDSSMKSGRNHQFRVEREYAIKNNARHEFILNRISNKWNSLNPYIVNAPSVNSFKNKLDSSLFS